MIEQLLHDNLLIRIFEQPLGWRLWIFWMMAVNSIAFLYLGRREGKVITALWVGNIVTMMSMYWMVGYVRLLGLSHVIWWTPLVIWLIAQLRNNEYTGKFGLWLKVLLITNLASLVIDYLDVARWLMGERG